MEIRDLIRLLDGSWPATEALSRWGTKDATRAQVGLVELANAGLTLDVLAGLCKHFAEFLPTVRGSDDVLAAAVQMIVTARSPLSLAAMLEREKNSCKMLLQALSLGPRFQEQMIADPEALDYLLASDGQPASREMLEDLLLGEISSLSEERALTDAFWRLAGREMLRVAYSQFFHRYRVELILEQLTIVREALLEGAFQTAMHLVKQQLRRGTVARPLVEPSIAVLATGDLGGGTSDYLTPAEIFFICETTAEEESSRRMSLDFGERVLKTTLRLVGSEEQNRPPLAINPSVFPPEAGTAELVPADLAAGYMDGYGRTWHRQRMVKARAIAGNRVLGNKFVAQLTPWIYRRYLSQADETGIQALKRRMSESLQQILAEKEAGNGSRLSRSKRWLSLLRETVEFLQLLWGGDQLEVRTPSTLHAIATLEMAGAISITERTSLERSVLQLEELCLQAQLMEWSGRELGSSLPEEETADWEQRLQATTEFLASTLGRLLGDGPAEQLAVSPEGDLLLTPMPEVTEVQKVLGKYGFAQPLEAYSHLQSLAVEPISFLSTRSCRHHLALLADRLLAAVAATPDPDFTLDNLLRVSNSLGAKGVLWELFLKHAPSLQLYVRLCGASRYLSEILIRNPGMIDDLVDALQLAHLPTADRLEQELFALCRGKEETFPILRAFKDAQHLRIGVRNLVGKEPLSEAQRALTDLADLCLVHVLSFEYARLVEKHGEPHLASEGETGGVCQFTVLVTGKMGSREPNYHSDLEILLVYAGDGVTVSRGKKGATTTTQHFFTQLAQRISKQLSALTPQGRLYSVKTSLASRGDNTVEALSLEQLVAAFTMMESGSLVTASQLLRARSVGGHAEFGQQVLETLRETLLQLDGSSAMAMALRDWRSKLERDASEYNLKRGQGGTLDIEAIALALPWQAAGQDLSVAGLTTPEVLRQLGESHLGLSAKEVKELAENYAFLRSVEAGLRLLNPSGRHELPHEKTEVAKLAMLVKAASGERVLAEVDACQQKNRKYLDRLLPMVVEEA